MTAISESKRIQRETLARTTMYIVLGVETIFFGTLITSYLFLRNGQTDWPFANPSIEQTVVPGLNTLLILASALIAWHGERDIKKGNVNGLSLSLALTVGLGLLFVVGQVFEFNRAGMRPDDETFGGVFFALMGFHALHVLAGLVFLVLNFGRSRMGDFSARSHIAVTMGLWFWYYVVAVWVLLFSVLYLV